MTPEVQANYDRRVGSPQKWWKDLVNFKLANEEATAKDLAARVGKSVPAVRWVMHSTPFKAMYDAEKYPLGRVTDTQAALDAMTTGLRFKYTKGQLETMSLEFLGDAMNETGTTTVIDKNGEPHEVPKVSFKEKMAIALKVFEVTNGKGTTIVGKQVNVDNSQTLNVTVLDQMSPAMRELCDAVIGNMPVRQVDGDDGSKTFLLDIPAAEVVDVTTEDEEA